MGKLSSLRTTNILKIYAFDIALWIFWYLAMFPGRVGYDTKVSLEMLRSGSSTDWWTGWYWRVLQVLSLNGATIIPFASFSYALTIVSFYWLVNGLPMSRQNRRFVKRATIMLPILPVFAMTVQHDIFLLIGLLLLFGLEIRISSGEDISKRKVKFLTVSILLLFLTTHQGLILAIYLILRMSFVLRARIIKTILYLLATMIFTSASGYAIDNTQDKDSGVFIPSLMDIKCIVQDPDSAVKESDWKTLKKLLPEVKWKEPYRCDEINANDWLTLIRYSELDIREFVRTYLSLASKNGEIVLMAHIARSNYVLPPPFFHRGPNQVNLDFSRPIGEGTNVALQTGPPVLHPSVDDPNVKVESKLLKPLEYVAQASIFIINQSSWFWGWGGLWLWPIILYSLLLRNTANSRSYFNLFAPFLLLHFTLFSIGISSTPRHVTSTVVVGIVSLLATLSNFVPEQK